MNAKTHFCPSCGAQSDTFYCDDCTDDMLDEVPTTDYRLTTDGVFEEIDPPPLVPIVDPDAKLMKSTIEKLAGRIHNLEVNLISLMGHISMLDPGSARVLGSMSAELRDCSESLGGFHEGLGDDVVHGRDQVRILHPSDTAKRATLKPVKKEGDDG